MGMMTSNSGRGRGRLIADINVTPLVDVVLVLLVIFMLAAPVLFRNSIKVKLPEAAHGEKAQDSPLVFSIDRDGRLFQAQQPLAWDQLTRWAGELKADQRDQWVVISADQDAKHGQVIRLMDALKSAGLNKFSMNVDKKR